MWVKGGIGRTPEEEEAFLRTEPEFQREDAYLPEIIKELKQKGIPYEITDNFPAAS